MHIMHSSIWSARLCHAFSMHAPVVLWLKCFSQCPQASCRNVWDEGRCRELGFRGIQDDALHLCGTFACKDNSWSSESKCADMHAISMTSCACNSFCTTKGILNENVFLQVMDDDHVADLAQWVVESSSAGESETTSKRFATANTMLTAVNPSSKFLWPHLPRSNKYPPPPLIFTEVLLAEKVKVARRFAVQCNAMQRVSMAWQWTFLTSKSSLKPKMLIVK